MNRRLTQRQRCISIADVLSSDSHQRELLLLAQLDGVVAVLQLLHELPQRTEALMDALPIDRAGSDDVEQLEDDEPVRQVGVQPVHIRLHAHRVHPVPVSFLLAGLLDALQAIDRLRLIQSRVVVEQVGDEGQIELVNSIHDVLRCDEASTVELRRLLQHRLGPMDQVRLVDRFGRDAGLGGRDLFQQVRVNLWVADVAGEVVATTLNAGALQVVIDPSEENRFRRQLHQVLETLIVVDQRGQAGTRVQRDVTEETDADDLPQQAEDEMGLSLLQVVRIDVDDVAADRRRRHEGQRQILELRVHRQVLLVDRPLVDGVGTRVVDELAQQNPVLDLLVQRFALRVDGQQVF